MSVEIRQAPGWWPSLVQVVCDECGHRGPVRDLNKDTWLSGTRVKLELDLHRCGEVDES